MILFRYLQGLGFARRKIMSAIKDRTLFVNDKIVEEFKTEISNGMIIGGLIAGQKISEKVIIQVGSTTVLFYKPVGYVTAKTDAYEKTIYTILPEKYQHLKYVGRLDRDSEGLLILSSDHQLINQLSHPGFDHSKEYHVTIDKSMRQSDVQKMIKGLLVSEEGRLSATGELLKCENVKTIQGNQLLIVLNYGKKRHIRRILSALGYIVTRLIRVRHGDYHVGNLVSGQLLEI